MTCRMVMDISIRSAILLLIPPIALKKNITVAEKYIRGSKGDKALSKKLANTLQNLEK